MNPPREFDLIFSDKADHPIVRVRSAHAYIKYHEIVHVIEYSAYIKLQERIKELEARDSAKTLLPR